MSNGYSAVWHNGSVMSGHRVAYELWNGKFDASLHVLHKCNNRSCVNPEHLYLGGNVDNCRDRIKAGTQYNINTRSYGKMDNRSA